MSLLIRALLFLAMALDASASTNMGHRIDPTPTTGAECAQDSLSYLKEAGIMETFHEEDLADMRTLFTIAELHPKEKLEKLTQWLKFCGLWDKFKEAKEGRQLLPFFGTLADPMDYDKATATMEWIKSLSIWKTSSVYALKNLFFLCHEPDIRKAFDPHNLPDIRLGGPQPDPLPEEFTPRDQLLYYLALLDSNYDNDKIERAIKYFSFKGHPLNRVQLLMLAIQLHGKDHRCVRSLCSTYCVNISKLTAENQEIFANDLYIYLANILNPIPGHLYVACSFYQ